MDSQSAQIVRTMLDDITEEYDEQGGSFRQVREIIPVRQWLRSEYYLGEEANNLYPYWQDVLVEFFDGDHDRGGLPKYNELILTGSIGTGKSYAMVLALLRSLYCLTCFDYPQSIFGLSRSKQIIYIYLSVSLGVTEITGFHQLRNVIDQIPYFEEHCKRNPYRQSMIEFKAKRLAMMQGSGTGHFIGSDLFGAVLDEANFSKPGANARAAFRRASDTYEATFNRRISRFMHKGKLHGFSGIASSSESQSSFVEKRMERAKTDSTIMAVSAKLWDVRPERFSRQMFHVFKGNELMDAKIMERLEPPKRKGARSKLVDDPEAVSSFKSAIGDTTNRTTVPALIRAYPDEFLPVPIDFYDRFVHSMETALKDLGGLPSGGQSGLPVVREYYNICFRTMRQHPFKRVSFPCSTHDTKRIEDYVDWRKLRPVEGAVYFVHFDLSETNDCTGLTMCHREQVRGRGFSESIYVIDFMLRLDPPKPPARISIRKVREFIIHLKRVRYFDIRWVTGDRFGSAETIQELNAAGIESTVRSVDRTDAEYMTMTQLINETRMVAYFYEPFDEEIWKLERDRMRQKVDHPPGGSKDVTDSVAGSVADAVDYYMDVQPSPSPGVMAEMLRALPSEPSGREDLQSFVVGDYEQAEGGEVSNLRDVTRSPARGEGRNPRRPGGLSKKKAAPGVRDEMARVRSLTRRTKKRR